MASFPTWFESRLPKGGECSLGHRLFEAAEAEPGRTLLVRPDGHQWSAGQLRLAAADLASGLRALGIGAGDRVLVWLPTSEEMVRTLFALSILGATVVPLNTSLRGNLLAHMIAIANAELIICHGRLVERLAEVDTGRLRTLLLFEEGDVGAPRLETVHASQLGGSEVSPVVNRPWDLAAILFSSGTTGPSKGVRIPAAQLWTLSRAFYGYMRPADRMLLMYPLFHIAGLSAVYGTMNVSASLAVTEAFSASSFWNVLEATGSTTVPGLGPTFIDILAKPERSERDRGNGLRHANVQSISPAARAFADRFGCSIMGSYSMTETSGICMSAVDDTRDGAVGRPRDGLQVRVVDQHDVEVAPGEVGELVVRADLPWTLNDGYEGNEAATVAAWRNGWFHTGDSVRMEADGYVVFVDRKKDVIRRRSENISSAELEAEVRQFEAVQDAAAIGVDTPEGEEVLVVVAPVPGRIVEPLRLVEFLIPRLPHYMVPRFVRVLPELPKTHTNRVQKQSLRAAGLTPDCWDREAAGIRLKGQRLA